MSGSARTPALALAAAAGAALLVHGWDALLADDGRTPPAKSPDAAPPKWFRDALAEMKETKSWGVAIRAPAKEEERKALAKSLEAAMARGAERATLLEAVYVVVGARTGPFVGDETVCVLDPDGRRVEGARADFLAEDEETRKASFATIRRLLHDDPVAGKRARLRQRAAACRDAQFDAALKDLAGEDEARSSRALNELVRTFDTHRAAVVEAALDAGSGGTDAHPAIVLLVRGATSLPKSPGLGPTRLPWGAEWVAFETPREAPDPCPPCGMAVLDADARKFLRLLAEDDAQSAK